MMKVERMPTTPGEMLKEEFLTPLKWTKKDLANRMKCDVKIIDKLINNKIPVSDTVAKKLDAVFNTGPEFWLNLQKAVDIYKEYEKTTQLKSLHTAPINFRKSSSILEKE